MKSLIKLNVVFFALYFLLQLLGTLESFFVFRVVRSSIELIVILVLGGLNMAALVQLFFKYDFDFWEILSLASVMGLLFVPLLLTIEFSYFHILFEELPAVNSFLIFLILLTTCYFKRRDFKDRLPFGIDKVRRGVADTLVSSPFFWIFILNITVTFIIFSTYYALSDFDPFYWIQRYAKDFEEGVIVRFTADRPIFSSFVYILSQSSHINLYATFKYALPLFSILSLIPAWLIARKFPSKTIQTIILLLPLTSPSTISYLQIPIPQAISIISIYNFCFFLIYSWLFEKKVFYYLAGITAFLGFFYHEVAAVIFTIWFLITLIFKHRFIFGEIMKNKLSTLLATLLIISNTSFLENQLTFLLYWVKLILKYIFIIKLNLFFPAYYINMNGQSMGWGNSIGVLKYYLYFAGPPILILLFVFTYLIAMNEKFREFVISLRTRKEVLVLIACFLIFFSISEILPRFSDIALLPDRAWVFAGIFSLTFFFIILKFFKNEMRFNYFLVILFAISMSIGGALYINNFKKYTITNTMITSAKWVQENLPDNRIIFTALDRNLLKYYGQSAVLKVPIEFYFDYETAKEQINKHTIKQTDTKANLNLPNEYSQFIKLNKENSEKLRLADPFKQKDSILVLLEENIQESIDMRTSLSMVEVKQELAPTLYIYYSKPNEKNPYIDRPYYSQNLQGERELIFDQYPDEFQRIYEDTANNIVIWKIL